MRHISWSCTGSAGRRWRGRGNESTNIGTRVCCLPIAANWCHLIKKESSQKAREEGKEEGEEGQKKPPLGEQPFKNRGLKGLRFFFTGDRFPPQRRQIGDKFRDSVQILATFSLPLRANTSHTTQAIAPRIRRALTPNPCPEIPLPMKWYVHSRWSWLQIS